MPIRVALLVMALIEFASAQTQEDWAVAKGQAETVFQNVNLEITNPPREPIDRIAMCRRLLPQVDDAFRVAMAYGRAVDAGEKATVQREYDVARRLLLQIMGSAQFEIDNASQAAVLAKEAVAQGRPTPQMPTVAIEGGEKLGGLAIGVSITPNDSGVLTDRTPLRQSFRDVEIRGFRARNVDQNVALHQDPRRVRIVAEIEAWSGGWK